MEYELAQLTSQIKPLDPEWTSRAQARLDSLTKPPGSLGKLEELAARYVAIREEIYPRLESKRVVVFAGDHGVVAEKVSAYPQEVTFQMVHNFLQGGAAINVLGRHAGVRVEVVDIGVNHDFEASLNLVSRKVAPGTKNMAKEPAMTREEALRALWVGVERAQEAVEDGVDVLAAGEMGIGNTTAAAALGTVFTGRPAGALTGRGTGIDDATLTHKVAVINRAVALNKATADDPLGSLAAVGGLEIAGITGLILGAAAARRPLVLDGFIATAGALVAARMVPAVADYLIAAHRSMEPGHQIMLDHLGLLPLLNLKMRLGEGTGAVLGINLLQAGVRIYCDMATFEEAGVAEKKG